ncbi:major capsid protein [Kitasatospora sp. NPDC097643]|uniref:major capsid protein n=1 Tax=Kitasatospora sp. NPDC097643 TaxID=3157230 RepID=UPI00331EB418
MALTLAESAKLSTENLQRGVVETFVQESPILDRLPLIEFEGTSYRYNEESALPGVSFRAVNEAYPESVGAVSPRIETLAILGGDSDVDKFIVKTRGDINDQRAIQETLKVKAASVHFSDQFFNGDTALNPLGFDGLRKRLIGRQVLDAKGVGPVANGYDFFDALDALTAQVRGITGQNGALYMNAAILAKIRSGFRRLGGAELPTAEIHGKETTMWNGIPMLDPGQKLDGTDVLPLTVGTGGKETGDIYAVRFGSSEADAGVSGLTNGGIQVTDLGEAHDKPVFRTRIEFYCGIALFGGKAAARLTNVLNG